MRAFNLGCLTAIVMFMAVMSRAGADTYQGASRMDLYEAQARQYVADRTQPVASRTRYVQPRLMYVDHSPIHQRSLRHADGRVSVMHNPSYHSQTVVTVVEDRPYEDRDVVRDAGYVDDGYVEVSRTYVSPSHFAGYSGYRGDPSHRIYRPYPAYHCPPVYPVYCDYPVYRPYPAYRSSIYYRHGYPYRDHYGPRYGGYYGGYYGRSGRCGSHWGISVHFRF